MAEESAAYSVRIDDAEQARRLVETGGSLLLLDVPPSTQFGINQQMFLVGPKFRGLKMLPPGPHFVYYSSKSRYGMDTSPTIGFFLYVRSSQVIVMHWDPQEERIAKLNDSSEEERYTEGVRKNEFDPNLAPYDLPHHNTWQHLSNYVSANVIDRLQPVGGDITVMAETDLLESGPQSSAEMKMHEHATQFQERMQKGATTSEGDDILEERVVGEAAMPASIGETMGVTEKRKSDSSGRCFYTHLPRLIKRAGLVGSELTALNLDKSQQLEFVLRNSYGGSEDLLLGELQFAFIAFLMGQSLEAFGQWKAIVSLFFSCEAAPLHSRTQLFTKFMEVMYWQLKQGLKEEGTSPAGPFLDESWLAEDMFLHFHMKVFFSSLKAALSVDGALLYQARRLKKLVETVLGWSLETETEFNLDDEYAPVVVSEEDGMLVES
ncbi:unnamed protein product [Sphagnum troendelagicum]|uniref:Protein AAR2 homolog n=1 Tax=Sphagnum troendelagicum TaxID=128251 RepID=A0ABP0U991_9BRYO